MQSPNRRTLIKRRSNKKEIKVQNSFVDDEDEDFVDMSLPISKMFSKNLNEAKLIDENNSNRSKLNRNHMNNRMFVSGTTLGIETDRFGRGLLT